LCHIESLFSFGEPHEEIFLSLVLKPDSNILALEEKAFQEEVMGKEGSGMNADTKPDQESASSSSPLPNDPTIPIPSHTPSPKEPLSSPPFNSSFEIREMEITDFHDVFQLGCSVFWDDEFWDDGEVVELFQTDSECCLVAQDHSGAIIGTPFFTEIVNFIIKFLPLPSLRFSSDCTFLFVFSHLLASRVCTWLNDPAQRRREQAQGHVRVPRVALRVATPSPPRHWECVV
jgi:hypothetical protein